MKPAIFAAFVLMLTGCSYVQTESLDIGHDNRTSTKEGQITPEAVWGGIPQTSARFPGCEDMQDERQKELCSQGELLRYIKLHFQYPTDYQGPEGKAFVQFMVDSLGNIQDVKVMRGVSPQIDQACIRVVEQMPRWIPGTQRGRKAGNKVTIPIDCTKKASQRP
jgi:TonB family protein